MKNNKHIDPDVQSQILTKLDDLEKTEDFKILFAIESGSRAWGFPSPDSDYDVRFVYARPADWYLSVFPGRDVTELPLDEVFDVNGWDIKKALELLMKPNPVLLEWLASPVRYRWDEKACAKISSFAEKVAHGKACLYHYLNLGGRQWRAYIEGKDQVRLKKYLYVVRPAMAIRWLRMNPDRLPPMNFFELREGADLPQSLENELDVLLEKKLHSKEMGEGAAVPEINEFILKEFEWAAEAAPQVETDKVKMMPEADALFRELVKRD